MRSYSRNSPHAAGRIVALAILADGHLAPVELEALEREAAFARLGLGRPALHDVIHGLCEDLLWSATLTWSDVAHADPGTLAAVMSEVDDRDLQLAILQCCVAVVEADGHVAPGESIALTSAVEYWGLQRDMLAPAQAVPQTLPA